MRLQIEGGTEVHRRHCRQFARFFSNRFFSKDLNKQILVKLKLTKKDIGYDDDCAYVEWMDNNRQPRKFVINIYTTSNPSLRYIISTLAHEMVHVKQFVKNELIDLPSTNYNVSVFKNKKYNLNRVAYYDQPWEIEAFGRERGLTREYFEKVKLAKKLLKRPVDF
ncbi:MAG: hypothetical protein EBY03_06370 [Actinobacteria bacterium]|nr:hypothetical protein [Actinomycetota bacterium]